MEVAVRESRTRHLPPVKLTAGEDRALRAYAATHELTLSDLVRRALSDYLRGVRRPAHHRRSPL